MFILYSLLYTLGFVLMLPVFLVRRRKYLPGLSERLGRYPEFQPDGRPVIWVHCVSVGETNAARPLVDQIRRRHPNYRIVISTITRSGQELAKRVYAKDASLICYFPFDWRFTARRALKSIRPNIVFIVETEIWFNFMREAHKKRSTIVLVNGRISEKSFRRYKKIKKTIRRVMRYFDQALVQTEEDAARLKTLGMSARKLKVTGNLKFDQEAAPEEGPLKAYFRERFGSAESSPLILAASTHAPEEKWILEAYQRLLRTEEGAAARLMIAPRHAERFEEVAGLIKETGLLWTRRTSALTLEDDDVKIILLDSIGELRSAYPSAEIVFVGGSLIPHGGQNLLEPAVEKKAIVTGSYMMNFEAISRGFAEAGAFVQVPDSDPAELPKLLAETFGILISDKSLRKSLGESAYKVVMDNRGASRKTIQLLEPYLKVHDVSVLKAAAHGRSG